jgi:hypothetical protein
MLNPQFGCGVFFGIPNAGNIVALPTPQQFGILQEVSVEFKADLKKLYGQQQFPVAKARGKIDVTAKGKMASLDPNFFSQLYFGQPTSTGVARTVYAESHPFAASIAPANPTANVDLGVIDLATGLALVSTQAAPTEGQYKFTPAVPGSPGTPAAYTFFATETDAVLLLNYQWPDPTGTTLQINNQLMGYAPEFRALLYNDFRASMFALQLNSCILGSLTVPTKQEDFWVSDFDLDASTDAAGVLGYIYSDQA